MRIKKGFTLAEILIVLMVIGVIATMTVPSLMKGVNEATYKTAFKKAFNAVTNIAAVEKISGQLPVSADATSALNFFSSLNSNLSVKEYSTALTAAQISSTAAQPLVTSDQTFVSAIVKAGDKTSTYGTTTNAAGTNLGNGFQLAETTISATTPSPWIVTEDSLAYAVAVANAGTCQNKAVISAQATHGAAVQASCVVVFVDVNGLAKGPNKFETQVLSGVPSTGKMNQLEGDRYYIFVGSDGVAAGPKSVTVSGRLMSDMK